MGPSLVKLLASLLCTAIFAVTVGTGASSDRVLLKDVAVLTLRNNKYTSGRRSSPVPQLTCVGGSARGHFTPEVVQCYNRGSDGREIQWECKTDMDNAYRFGSVEVTCEGYDYPDDPFILAGSCGLEYTVDFTEEGYQRQKQQKSHHYGHSDGGHYSSNYGSWGKKSKSVVGDLLFLGGVALVIYIIYKSCLAPSTTRAGDHADSTHRPRTDRGGDAPPPYGFRDEYMPGSDSCSGSSAYGSSSYNTNTGTHHNTGNQGGGFWSGAATGGLLGYLFGRNNGYGGYTQHQPYSSWGSSYRRPYTGHSPGWFSGWGSGGHSRTSYGGSSSGSGFSFGGGSSSVSSGTRTASGFGGTKRR